LTNDEIGKVILGEGQRAKNKGKEKRKKKIKKTENVEKKKLENQ
jgi:hypothetical protein